MIRTFMATTVFLLASLATPALATDYRVGEIQIMHSWARASAGQVANGVTYLTLKNSGSKPDRLAGASSPVAKHASLHTLRMEGGMMKMLPVANIEVGPGGTTRLEPGGLHIMLMGLKVSLKEGETFPLTLTFERSGAVTIEVVVKEPGAMAPGYMKH